MPYVSRGDDCCIAAKENAAVGLVGKKLLTGEEGWAGYDMMINAQRVNDVEKMALCVLDTQTGRNAARFNIGGNSNESYV